MANTDACVKAVKEKALKRQNEILDIIDCMIKDGQKVSFYSVQKASGASKSYLYNNPVISTKIRNLREIEAVSRTENSNEVIIKALRLQIKKLQAKIKELESMNFVLYKRKYEEVKQENIELKKQLKTAYQYNKGEINNEINK